MSREFKLPVILIAFIVTLGVFLGGYSLYNRYLVQMPLQDELKKVHGVKQVDVQRQNKKMHIKAEMAEVKDFVPAYRAVDEAARKRFGPDGYTLEVGDHRGQKLQEVYDGLQLYLYEGIAKNSFLWLNREIGRVAREQHLRYKLSVDEHNLYLQLHDNHGHYLYAVIERGEKTVKEEQTGR